MSAPSLNTALFQPAGPTAGPGQGAGAAGAHGAA
ncbi:MAG: hypothetical protein JWP49_942, partial [Phenylobacterium sp.]|nr:hypothetical protein [Phenylobacterium sp.]